MHARDVSNREIPVIVFGFRGGEGGDWNKQMHEAAYCKALAQPGQDLNLLAQSYYCR